MKCAATMSIGKRHGMDYTAILSHARGFKRSSVAARESKAAISFTISASDPTALRATINSVLRDIKVVEAAASVKIPQKRKR